MVCKNCGLKIEDTAEFCPSCGNRIEDLINIKSKEVESSLIESENISQGDKSLEEIMNEIPIKENKTNNLEQNTNFSIDNNNDVNINETKGNYQKNELKQKEKNNKKELVWVMSGVAIALILIVLVVCARIFVSNNSISVLKLALGNMEKAKYGITVDLNLSLISTTGETLDFLGTIKTENKSNNETNIQMILNKSVMFDEINTYAVLNKEKLIMYMESKAVDMLMNTSSTENTWIYNTISLSENEQVFETFSNTDLNNVIDEEHFIYIGEVNKLKHYELIVDQELVDKAKTKISESNNSTFIEMLGSIDEINEPLKIKFYITKSNTLSKIEFDLSKEMSELFDVSSCIISVEFSNIGSTKVQIPNDVKESSVNLDTYMMNNSKEEDFDYGFNFDEDEFIESDFNNNEEQNENNSYDGMLTYDTSVNIQNEFSINVPSVFSESIFNDAYKYAYEYESNLGVFDDCSFSLSQVQFYTSSEELITSMRNYHSSEILNEMQTTKINNIDWHWFSYLDTFGTTYYYSTNKDNRVFLFEYQVSRDSDTECINYKNQVLNSIK